MSGNRLRTVLDLWRAQLEGAEGLARRQVRRFSSLLAYARSASPFYRSHYRDLPADGVVMRDLPPVDKRALMAAFDEWVTDSRVTLAGIETFMSDPGRIGTLYEGKYFVCTSAGTTGRPGVFVFDGHAVDTYRAITSARISPAWVGARGMRRMARRAFRWASVLGTGGHYAGAGWMELERRRSRWRSRSLSPSSMRSIRRCSPRTRAPSNCWRRSRRPTAFTCAPR